MVTLGNEIGRARCIFNFGKKSRLIKHEVEFGISFSKPSRKVLRKDRLSKPKKFFSADELRTLYAAADDQMKLFIMLGANCAFGPADIGQLTWDHIQGDWIVFPRSKTLVDRRCNLWPETKSLIEKHTGGDDTLVFRTKYGQPWHRDSKQSPLSQEFRKLCVECGLHKHGRGFYSLRHTFRTVADEALDVVAINVVMGHSDNTMGLCIEST